MKYYIFFLTICFFGCSEKHPDEIKKEKSFKVEVAHDPLVKEVSTVAKNQKKERYVIYYYPDSLGREELLKINGEDGMDQVIQDNMDYFYPILQHLDSLQIKTTIVDDKFLMLKNGISIKRKELDNPYFGLLLIENDKKYNELNLENYRKILNQSK